MTFQTVEIPLTTGSIYWDGQYSIASSLINMLVSTDGRLLPFPICQILARFKQHTAASDTPPVSILGIVRMYTSSKYVEETGIWQYTSTYAVIVTPYYSNSSDSYSNLVQVTIDEASKQVISMETSSTTVNSVKLYNNYKNRPKFTYAINSKSELLFVDDEGSLCYISRRPDESISHPDTVLWTKSVAAGYSGDTITNVMNTLGVTAVQSSADDGSVKYKDFLYNGEADTHDRCTLVCILNGWGIIYNATQNLLFFTSSSTYGQETTTSKVIGIGGLNSVVWKVQPIYNEDGKTLKRLGIPLIQTMPAKVLDMQVLSNSLFVFTEERIIRYNLTVSAYQDAVTKLPVVQPILNIDTTFNYQFKSAFGGCSLLFKNLLFFITQDNKQYVLNVKGEIKEITHRGLPGKYYFEYNYYTNVDGTQPRSFFINRTQFPLSLLGMDCIVSNYVLLNMTTNTYSYIVPNTNTTAIFGKNDQYLFNQPEKITASSEDGRFFALGDGLYSTSQDYANRDDRFPDVFSDAVFISSPIVGDSSHFMIERLYLVVKLTCVDPLLSNQYLKLAVGVDFIPDVSFSSELMNNWRDLEYWETKKQLFSLEKSATIESGFAINTYVLPDIRKTCQSFILALRFGDLVNPGEITSPALKYMVLSVKYNYKSIT